MLAGCVVLAGEGDGSLREGVDGEEGVVLVVECCSRARDRSRAVAVDSRLDHRVRKREHAALDSRGQADDQDVLEGTAAYAQGAQIQAIGLLLAHEEGHAERAACSAGDERGQGDARGAPQEVLGEEQVQGDVEHGGQQQGVERAGCVAMSAQERCRKVVNGEEGQRRAVDAQVDEGVGTGVCRHADEAEHRV